MNKFLIIFSIITVVATVVFFSDRVNAQSGDLCGGTGGNGEIVSVGSNTFTLKHNDGRSLIVNLTSRATIETPAGYASLSDLDMGDRVTLVGDDNRNGTFTADAVVLCNATQEVGTQENGTGSTSSSQAGQTNSIAVRNINVVAAYNSVNLHRCKMPTLVIYPILHYFWLDPQSHVYCASHEMPDQVRHDKR